MRTSKILLLAGSLLTFLASASAAEKSPTFSKADLSAANTLRERALVG